MKFLEEASITGKRVLLRINADVPLTPGKPVRVADDFRLRQELSTIHYLLDYGARIVLVAHLGRPEGRVVPELSLRPIYQYLAGMLKKPIKFAPTLFSDTTEKAVQELKDGEILALENIRFDPGEEKNTRTFAAKLARYGDIYVNEAFSVSHHQASSLVAITELLPSYGGLLLEREVTMLGSLMADPARPYVAVIGGAKISDKLPAIKQIIRLADKILVGGGVANTFLKASGVDVKKSLIDESSLQVAKETLKNARGKLILPQDFIWSAGSAVDIGPKTEQLFSAQLKSAHTAFWSGPLGKIEDPNYTKGSFSVARAMIDSGATTIVGGGDTVRFLDEAGLASQFSFVSTGGSATLEFLGGQRLAGLKALD